MHDAACCSLSRTFLEDVVSDGDANDICIRRSCTKTKQGDGFGDKEVGDNTVESEKRDERRAAQVLSGTEAADYATGEHREYNFIVSYRYHSNPISMFLNR